MTDSTRLSTAYTTAGSDRGMPAWKKSSYSAQNGCCVEVAAGHHSIAVRDSKNPESFTLQFQSPAWGRFLVYVKAGGFDLPAAQ